MAWEIDSEDDESPKIKAIGLYQDLLRFHENDDVPDAFVEANLLRLRYGFNQSFGEEKKARYKAALKRFAQEWADHEMSARAMFRRAEVLRGEGELAEAHKLAKRGAAVFPDSVGGKECKNLINQIESKSSSVSTERIWNAPLPKIQLRYRNLTKAYFRIIPFDWVSRMKQSQRHPEYVDHRRKGEWLNKQPLKEWSVDLAPTDDFKERVEKIDAPKDLEPGSYFLFASHDPKFGEQENRVSYSSFWVSDLSLVMRTRHGSGALEGFVLNAITGEPVKGQRSVLEARTQQPQVELKATRTDANGLFSIKAGRTSLTALASHQGQSLSTANSYYVNDHSSQRRPYERSVFFTDRSLYRPGQTIRYKGVSYRIDQENDNYKVIPNRDLTVVFRDRNNQEIARLKHRTNDYGSFDGSFTAPRDRLMGRMRIQIEARIPRVVPPR